MASAFEQMKKNASSPELVAKVVFNAVGNSEDQIRTRPGIISSVLEYIFYSI
jgi:hypothetical protein